MFVSFALFFRYNLQPFFSFARLRRTDTNNLRKFQSLDSQGFILGKNTLSYKNPPIGFTNGTFSTNAAQ